MFETITSTTTGYRQTCDRCGGSGRVDQWRYVADGVCFRCHGEGALGASFATPEALEAHLATLARKRDQREAKREADRVAQWEAERPQREAEEAQREADRVAHEAELAQWKHLEAQLGDSVTVSGVVAVATTIDTQYGSSRLIVVESAQREAVKLFTTAEWSWSVESGEALTVTGVVKSFDNYDGKPQTVLNRPKRLAG